MDQGVIHTFMALVLKVIENIEQKFEMKISILDAMIMLRQSWDKVSKKTIVNCFMRSGLSVCEPLVNEIELNELELFLPLTISEPVVLDDFVHVNDEVITAEFDG